MGQRVLLGTYIVPILFSLTFIIRLAGVDGLWLRQELGISVLIKSGPAVKMLSWQQHNRRQLVSFVINISGAKVFRTMRRNQKETRSKTKWATRAERA